MLVDRHYRQHVPVVYGYKQPMMMPDLIHVLESNFAFWSFCMWLNIYYIRCPCTFMTDCVAFSSIMGQIIKNLSKKLYIWVCKCMKQSACCMHEYVHRCYLFFIYNNQICQELADWVVGNFLQVLCSFVSHSS